MMTPLETSLVASLVSLFINRLMCSAENAPGNITKVNEKFRSLQVGAQRVQGKLNRLLGNAEFMSRYSCWVRELAEFCYDVDDLIDDANQAAMRRAYPSNQSISSRILGYVSRSATAANTILSMLNNRGLTRKMNKLLWQLKDLEQQIDNYCQENCILNNDNGNDIDVNNNDSQELPRVPSARSLPPGREIDRENIIKKLLQGTGSASGVSIIGMAGLGKTMLARSIVDDKIVRNRFPFIKWVSSIRGLRYSEPVTLSQPRGFNKRSSTKTLWVLDGLEEDPSDFLDNRIQPEDTLLITTRDPRVAIDFTHTAPYYLKRMSDEDCAQVIKTEFDCEQPIFKARVIYLAKNCMGLPLVATILGLTLQKAHCRSGAKAADTIMFFEQIDLWKSLGAKIIRALRFNDRKLARHLDKLVYFALFPHDHSLSKVGLVQLWMAEGFIQPKDLVDWESTLRHFDDMLPTSMVEPSWNHGSPEENPSAYQTNEITHWLAQSIAHNMCYRADTGEHSSVSSHTPAQAPRHLSLCSQTIEEQIFKEIAQLRRLRTFLLLLKDGTGIRDVPQCILNLFCLRVLDLSRSCIVRVPDSIGKLKHLRYLDLSYTNIKVLPDSICELFWLIILKLIKCSKLEHLPEKIGNLVNLIHLELSQTNLRSPPRRIGKLTKLGNLHAFSVWKTRGYRITELKNLNELRGSIKIMQLENVQDEKEAAEAELHMKRDLTNLSLEWGASSMPRPPAAEDILTQLRPHTNLTELRLTNYSGIQFPNWISHPSCHLRSVHLHNCPNSTKLPPLWLLAFLKTLRIESLSNIRSIERQFFGDEHQDRFMSLERLEFCNMQELHSFKGLEAGDMPCLEVLNFVGCPKLTELPTLHPLASLTHLEILRCPKLNPDRKLPLSLDEYFFEGELIPLIVYQQLLAVQR